MEALIKTISDLIDKPGGLPLPGGKYKTVNLRGVTAYVAIQFPISLGKYLYQGRLGGNLTTTEGIKAAHLCAVNVLAQLHHYVGLEKIAGLNHFDLYYQQDHEWDEGPAVADGASEFFLEVLKDKGVHTRAIAGVQHLPRNFSVGMVSNFTIHV